MNVLWGRVILAAATVIGLVLIFTVEQRVASIVFTASIALSAWTFVVLYYRRGLWRESPAGRALLAFPLSLALLVTYLMVSWAFGDWPGRRVVSTTLYLGLVLSTLNITLTLFRMTPLEEVQDGSTDTAA